jgi:hypothetical protein
MNRPPLWVWALPAAVGLGLLLGLRLRLGTAEVPPPPATPPASEVPATVPASVDSLPGVVPATTVPDTVPSPIADSAAWEAVGGAYQPLVPDPFGSPTLPVPPSDVDSAPLPAEVTEPAADQAPPVRNPAPGPAQELGQAAALRRPLIAVLRGGGRLSFYSAWEADATRASLVGDWGAVGACQPAVRVAYEQVVPGLGVVRGSGSASEPPPWTVAVVVPRQHCSAATARWKASRAPGADEAALLAQALGGERPTAVVRQGDRLWAASPGRVVLARADGEGLVVEWSGRAPEGATARLLGVWDGEGVFVAVDSGGRVAQVWRA